VQDWQPGVDKGVREQVPPKQRTAGHGLVTSQTSHPTEATHRHDFTWTLVAGVACPLPLGR
jgi:hypothetical protein